VDERRVTSDLLNDYVTAWQCPIPAIGVWFRVVDDHWETDEYPAVRFIRGWVLADD